MRSGDVKVQQPAKLAAKLCVMFGMGKDNRASNDLAAGIAFTAAVFGSGGGQLRAGGKLFAGRPHPFRRHQLRRCGCSVGCR